MWPSRNNKPLRRPEFFAAYGVELSPDDKRIARFLATWGAVIDLMYASETSNEVRLREAQVAIELALS